MRQRGQEQKRREVGEGLSRSLFDEITDIRLRRRQTAEKQATGRVRPPLPLHDGRLALLAADQPARGALAVAGKPLALGDRYAYLSRIVAALTTAGLDGVAGTTDVIEELLIICHLIERRGGPRILDGKLLLASMNPGGAAGSVWETDARLTSFVPQTVTALRLDGAKLTLRVAYADARTADAVAACAAAITELNALGLPVVLEVAPVRKADGRWRILREPSDLVRTAGLASALGDSSLGLWLALPCCHDFAPVAAATTLPLLVSAGAEATDPAQCAAEVKQALGAGPNVRGVLLAADVLFLDGGLEAAEAMANTVHRR